MENRPQQKVTIPPRPWADLPQDLLSVIFSFLNSNPNDTRSFRSVCKSWFASSSLPLPPKRLHPCLPLTFTASFPDEFVCSIQRCSHSSTTLSVTIVYALFPPISQDFPQGSAYILFVDQSNINRELTLRKPFSSLVYSLPLHFPRHLHFEDFRASELGRVYNIAPSTSQRVSDFSPLQRKLVLLSIPCGFFLVALSDEGMLGLITLPSPDTNNNDDNDKDKSNMEWKMIHDGRKFSFDDIVEFKGRVLGIDRRARVHHIHIIGGAFTHPQVDINVIVRPIAGGGGRRKRLVESLGRLYLVVRNKSQHVQDAATATPTTTAVFKVYGMDEGAKKWVEVTSLGDRTFFFGVDFSFSASADHLHGSCGKNWVLYKEHSFVNYTRTDDDYHLFINVKPIDHLRIGVWRFDDDARLAVIGSYPNYASLFWPPPCWIWPNDLFERVRSLLSALDHLQSKIPDYKIWQANLDRLRYQRQKKSARTVINLGIKMQGILQQAQEMYKMLKHIEFVAVSWQKHYKSANLHNQGVTLSRGNEESHMSIDSFKIIRIAFKQCNNDLDLISLEMMLHAAVLRLEDSTSKLASSVNSYGMNSIVVELKPLIDGAVK